MRYKGLRFLVAAAALCAGYNATAEVITSSSSAIKQFVSYTTYDGNFSSRDQHSP